MSTEPEEAAKGTPTRNLELDLSAAAGTYGRRSTARPSLDINARTVGAKTTLDNLRKSIMMSAKKLTPFTSGSVTTDEPPKEAEPKEASKAKASLKTPPKAKPPTDTSGSKTPEGDKKKQGMKMRVGNSWIPLRSEPQVTPVRATTFPKEDRDTWSSFDKMKVKEQATGNVLAKGDKLAVPTIKTDKDDTILVDICKLRNQLKTIKDHLITYDMLDVFMIVMPQDVAKTYSLDPDI